MNKPKIVITHHAVSAINHTVEDIDKWHKERWKGFTSKIFKNKQGDFFHVGYHYVIHWDGTITQTRGHSEEGAHCIGMNKSSIGVCFMGNFDHYQPSTNQLNAWHELYRELQRQYPGIPTRPHRAYATKSCHGKLLPDNYFSIVSQKLTMIDELQRLVIKLRSLLTGKRIK